MVSDLYSNRSNGFLISVRSFTSKRTQETTSQSEKQKQKNTRNDDWIRIQKRSESTMDVIHLSMTSNDEVRVAVMHYALSPMIVIC
jgi:hypothetical protein